MKEKSLFKKFLAALSALTLTVFSGVAVFTGCQPGNQGEGDGTEISGGGENGGEENETPPEKKAESITFSVSAVALKSKGTQELICTVLPADAAVQTEISDKTVVKYEQNTLTALTAGTATVKVYSTVDETVYAECTVTVAAPEGYTAYASADFKLVYPSSWVKQNMSGMLLYYVDASNSSNMNMTSSPKTNAYYTATADTFKNNIIDTYKSLGYTATFTNCTVDKSDYLGYTRVHVVYDYSVSSLGSIHQEQMVLNSGTKTYVLTVTNNSNSINQAQTDTILSEFVGLK